MGCSINGLTHINLTKLDVLSDLATIRLGVGYQLHGKPIFTVPAQLELLEAVTVDYEELPGWQRDISKAGPSWHTCVISMLGASAASDRAFVTALDWLFTSLQQPWQQDGPVQRRFDQSFDHDQQLQRHRHNVIACYEQ